MNDPAGRAGPWPDGEGAAARAARAARAEERMEKLERRFLVAVEVELRERHVFLPTEEGDGGPDPLLVGADPEDVELPAGSGALLLPLPDPDPDPEELDGTARMGSLVWKALGTGMDS